MLPQMSLRMRRGGWASPRLVRKRGSQGLRARSGEAEHSAVTGWEADWAQLQLGSPETSGGEDTQLHLVSGDEEELPPPSPDLRAPRAERRQAQRRSARLFARSSLTPSWWAVPGRSYLAEQGKRNGAGNNVTISLLCVLVMILVCVQIMTLHLWLCLAD